ncbi:nuclear transport factor 2 family protein [Pseudoduganella sp. FT25W]|uniref:Nuclear transport factor 2 family protein n=1 Tax=Duganella alba TaxID=2666081 RepID=A0A6L5QK73_9BURK|nr:nuclear transport factor 2 family protein [Duganella alba]MRX10085.1 nuclear transport factor 2 family protein [Duganella alba]MRX16727.1 nuclear transport factor 2 family protein [Duganella alba]
MTDHVQKLLDLEEIKNLRMLYGHYLDSNSLTELAELFAPDAVCNFGAGDIHGREAIRDGLAKAFIEYDVERHGSYPFLHAVTNQWVEIVDADTAQGRCYLLDLHTVSKPGRDPWILLGMYADEYQRIDGRWYIARSQLDVVWPSRQVGGGHPGHGLVLPVRARQ